MTIADLIQRMASRAAELDSKTIRELRELHPDSTADRGGVVKESRSRCIADILSDYGDELARQLTGEWEGVNAME